ncbi:MAG: hypothetical protein M1828_007105 [Chrysothrix sp. TS-e1954]|nr:MAG: hypothetical protein M1828_007105 [Chrysothrix sp. TS-e1954]
MFKSRKPTCFYCGSRSAQKLDKNVRMFKCEHCEAVNHLDAQGQITDPPARTTAVSSASLRYARSPSRATSPPSTLDPTDLFCDTCTKNQHLYQQNLASYLPSESSPDYPKYLQSYETYRQKLEERYPQVCPRCAPKVRERIRKAGYVAKTDFLQRMVESSRNGELHRRTSWRYTWRSIVLRLAGLGWYSSAVVQSIYHLTLATPKSFYEAYGQPQGSNNVLRQLQLLKDNHMANDLGDSWVLDSDRLISNVLLLSVSLIWWNPRLWNKYCAFSNGRMIHLFDYYCLQILVLAVRAVGYTYLSQLPRTSDESSRGINAFLAVFILAMTVMTSRVVQIDNRPRVSFHAREEDILPDIPEPTVPTQNVSRSRDMSTKQPLNIAKLAPQAPPNPLSPSNILPPTPPPDTNDYEEMDWSPSTPGNTQQAQSSANARSHNTNTNTPTTPSALFNGLNLNSNTGAGPSPFKASIPPAPPSRMQHPRAPIQPTHNSFRRATPAQQASFSQTFGQTPRKTRRTLFGEEIPDSSDEDSDADADASSVLSGGGRGAGAKQRRNSAREFQLKQPGFWPKANVETGLEGLFEEVFGFGDGPVLGRESGSGAVGQAAREVQGGGTSARRSDGLARDQVAGERGSWGLLSRTLLALVPALGMGYLAMNVTKYGNGWAL